MDVIVGLRVASDEEREGLDINLHGEEGYALGASTGGHSEYGVTPSEAAPASKSRPITVS